MNMTYRKTVIILYTVCLFSMSVLIGCSDRTLSNDTIEIKQYKKLEVTVPDNLSDPVVADQYEEQIWEAVIGECKVEKFPEEELSLLEKELEKQYSYVAYYEDKTAEELVEEIHGVTIEELAKKQLTKEYAVKLIAEHEKLILTEEEYLDELTKRATEASVGEEEYENMFGREELYQTFLEDRVMKFLKDNIK